jgi:predicted amidohydrolase YtcJ
MRQDPQLMSSPLRQFILFLVLLIVSVGYVLVPMTEHADTLFVNGRIHTMDSRMTTTEAIAVRGDRIVAVGTTRALLMRFSASDTIDLAGRVVLPGFIDAHAHLVSLGLARMTVDLVGSSSEGEAAQRVAVRCSGAKRGDWIRGRGWDQNDWPTKRFPSRTSLDRVAPENPVYLSRVDGHAAWANSRTLALANITRNTMDPPGGKIHRDANGEPTGILIDAAMELVQRVLPQPSDAELRQAIELATKECTSFGLTGMHDMGVDLRVIEIYRSMIDAGRFPLRVYALIDGPGETWDSIRRTGKIIAYQNKLTVRGIKLYVDGALGSRGAAMIEPYEDDPGNRGLTMAPDQILQAIVDEALQAGFQVCTHAIGDRGNTIALNLYEHGQKNVTEGDHRLRIEHVQVLHPSDIARFKDLSVIPSMQPTHCTSDMYWAEARSGAKRVRGAYAWRSLLRTGVFIPGGSDSPIESPNPIFGIAAAVNRRDANGRPASQADIDSGFELGQNAIADSARFAKGWYGEERMTVEEAIRSFTIWAATAAFEETDKGSIENGKLADFVVLNMDPFSISAMELYSMRVERTILGGKTVYGN